LVAMSPGGQCSEDERVSEKDNVVTRRQVKASHLTHPTRNIRHRLKVNRKE